MLTRDDFSETTKNQLAKRSGYRCSFPACGLLTCGPSDEGVTAISNVGMACHIASAASGKNARRYIATMTPDERKDISNGIWMCYLHGKLIDTDEVRFSIDVLKKWKENAESITKIMLERNCEYEQALKYYNFSSLVIDKIFVDGLGNENEVIGNAMVDCCVAQAWGKDVANAVRDFIIEIVRNAYEHGGATFFKFEAFENRIVLTDNGLEFNPKSLAKKDGCSGGIQSIKQLINKHGQNVIVSTQWKQSNNVSTIAILGKHDDIFDITPCCFELDMKKLRSENEKLELIIQETCNEVFIIWPTYIGFSDIGLIKHLRPPNKELTSITFVLKDASQGVIDFMKEKFPNIHIINIPD